MSGNLCNRDQTCNFLFDFMMTMMMMMTVMMMMTLMMMMTVMMMMTMMKPMMKNTITAGFGRKMFCNWCWCWSTKMYNLNVKFCKNFFLAVCKKNVLQLVLVVTKFGSEENKFLRFSAADAGWSLVTTLRCKVFIWDRL